MQQKPVEQWAEKIVSQYPNYASNEISKQAVRDSVNAYGENFVGKKATLLEGVKFNFARMVDRGDSVAVFFDATGCHTEYESEDRSVWTDINMRVLGKVDRQTAASLDKSKKYTLEGTVYAWDAEDRFFITNHMLEYIDLGTFILNGDITINEVRED